MRLWSLHPKYLDSKGLVALWREGLLAQSVLLGDTTGYVNHPQLTRFRATSNPIGAIASYLRIVVAEADARGYNFKRDKIANRRYRKQIAVTRGQLEYERLHLLGKLAIRDSEKHIQLFTTKKIDTHPVFYLIAGGIEQWEVIRPL